jgi:hypothetical protein
MDDTHEEQEREVEQWEASLGGFLFGISFLALLFAALVVCFALFPA